MGMEPQSTLSGFSVQTNRASCVFVRQKVFCQTKTNLPSLTVGDFPPKSEISNCYLYILSPMVMTLWMFNRMRLIRL